MKFIYIFFSFRFIIITLKIYLANDINNEMKRY